MYFVAFDKFLVENLLFFFNPRVYIALNCTINEYLGIGERSKIIIYICLSIFHSIDHIWYQLRNGGGEVNIERAFVIFGTFFDDIK